MTLFLQYTVIGLAMGMIYALMAMGLILLIKSVGIMNFAQGDLLMVGAYVSFAVTVQLGLNLFWSIIAAIAICGVFGLVFMFTVWYPVRNSSWIQATIVCTIGASTFLKEAVQLIWGDAPLAVPAVIKGTLQIGNIHLDNQYLLIIAVSVVIIFGVFFLYEKLYAGRIMQAASQNRNAAQILGIPVTATIAATYMIVCCTVGMAGYLVAPIFYVSTNLTNLQLKAFAGVVIGGFGNLKGAVIGSLIIGLIEVYSSYVTTTYRDVFVFGVLLLILAFRPQGLFKDKMGEKA